MVKNILNKINLILFRSVIRDAVFLGFVLTGWGYADEGLVAHYTFEEGPDRQVKDWSGNGNDGTIIGNVRYVELEEGKGNALRFNAGNAYVDCGNKPSLDLRDAVTIELWFYPETSPSG